MQPIYFAFEANFEKLKALYESLLDFENSIGEKTILLESSKEEIFIKFMILMAKLESDFIKAANNVLAMEARDVNRLFLPLSILLRHALIPLNNAKIATDSYIESNCTNMAHFNTLIENLAIMNKSLQELRDSSAWNGILEINSRRFNCETGWLKTKTMSPYKKSFDQYTQLAMSFELKDPELESIVANILDPVKFIFRNGTFLKPDYVHHYSAIIGPSFMGKTQFSFILARTHPVFYFNFFLDRESPQDIYCCFSSYSDEILKVITIDTEILSKTVNFSRLSESENLFHKKNLKLFTIGFIWSLIEHSMKFDFSKNDGNWFNHFLENREVSYTALSLNEFYDKMGKIVS
jgi:hypothetical protein